MREGEEGEMARGERKNERQRGRESLRERKEVKESVQADRGGERKRDRLRGRESLRERERKKDREGEKF